MEAAMLGKATLSIKVIRADGTVEDYGVVSGDQPKDKEKGEE